MPLDPIFEQLLLGMPSLVQPGESPSDVRQRFAELASSPVMTRLARKVGSVDDLEVTGAQGRLPARVYRPSSEGPHPTVVFFHGGAWFFGGPDSHDPVCREICRQVDVVVVAVDYRLAPEHPFPAAVEDCAAVTRWCAEHVADLGGDPERIAVAGDSAGGNLAAVVAQEFAGADEGPALAGQLLIYPATDVSKDYPSRELYSEGYFLDQGILDMATCYVTDLAQIVDPRVSPILHQKLGILPPTVVVTAEFDPIRDQGEAYADALDAAGVEVRSRRFDGLIHGFIHFGPFVPTAQSAIDETCAMFGELLRR